MALYYSLTADDLENTFGESPNPRTHTIGELDMAKEAKTRASRIPAQRWEELKAIICTEYKRKTLEALMIFLKEGHDLDVTKRQLVYRLGIWDCGKYNLKGCDGLPDNDGDANDVSEDDQSDEDSDLDDEDFVPNGGHVYEVPDALGLTSCFEEGSYTYDLITHHIQAANAIFAVAGGGYAWATYNDDFHDDVKDSKRLVALCRSAETVEQCRKALDILESQISQSSSHVGFWSLLYVHVVESMNHEIRDGDLVTLKDPIKEMLTAAVSSILLGSWDGFLLKEGGSVDLFAFHLLDTVYEQHHTLSLQLEEKKLGSLLYSMDDWVLSEYDDQEASSALVRLKQCAQWCLLSLEEVSKDLSQTRLHICSAHNEAQKDWKEHLEIYGTLWHRLFMQQLNAQGQSFGVGFGAGAEGLEWAENARRDLGISHAEVLSCMCWVIVKHGGPRNDNDGTLEGLFGRAKAAAQGMLNTEPRELWLEFLGTFKRLNDLTVTKGANAAKYARYRDDFMKEFVAFVEDTLKVFATFGGPKTGERIGDEFYPGVAF